jgi:hypothetical protein
MGVKIRLTVVSFVSLVALVFVADSRVVDRREFVGGGRVVRGSGVADGNRSASVVLARRGSRCLRFRGGYVEVESRHLYGIGWVDEGGCWMRRECEERSDARCIRKSLTSSTTYLGSSVAESRHVKLVKGCCFHQGRSDAKSRKEKVRN